MANKYFNRENRRLFITLAAALDTLEQAGDGLKSSINWLSYKYLNMGITFLRKFVNEDVLRCKVVQDDQKELTTMMNLIKNSKVHVKIDRAKVRFGARNHKTTKKGDALVEVTEDFVEDLFAVAMGNSCLGCKGIVDCPLKKLAENYGVPPMKSEPKYCKFEVDDDMVNTYDEVNGEEDANE